MISLRYASSRIPVSRVIRGVTATTNNPQHYSRTLSTEGAAALSKFQATITQYRQENYAQTIDSRFKKYIVHAATLDNSKSDRIPMDGLMRVIHNIGADSKMSNEEVRILFEELGDGSEIPIEGIEKIL